MLAGLLCVLLLVGGVSRFVLDGRLRATANLADRSVNALVVAQRLRAALAEAAATAAAGMFAWIDLVPSRDLGLAERRAIYDRMKREGFYTGDAGPDPDGAGDGAAGEAGDEAGDGTGDAAGDADGSRAAAAPNAYSRAIRTATTALLELRQIDPGVCDPVRAPDSRHCAMDRLATLVPEHVALVAEARANTRTGNPVGEAYLRRASELMRTRMLPQTDPLVAAYGGRVDADYRAATGATGEYVLAGAVGVALVSLAGAQAYLYRRSRRMLNPGLLAATCLMVAFGSLCIVQLGDQQESLAEAKRDGYVPMTLLAASRTLATQARTYELLSLVSLGDGDDADRRFGRAVAALGFTPAGEPAGPGALTEALARLGASERAELEGEFTDWLAVRERVSETLRVPPKPAAGQLTPDVFDEAVGTTLRHGAFERFTAGADEAVERRLAVFRARVGQAAWEVRVLAAVLPVILLVAAAGCLAGMYPRIREYL